MRSIGQRVGLVGAGAALVTGLGAPAVSAHALDDQPTAYESYVALGDSYTSGPFIPLLRLNPLGCARSTSNYPSMLAAALDVPEFTDVSCAGAATRHMTEPQDVVLGTNAPQFDALRSSTDLVTVGIGGNDFDVFGDVIRICPGLRHLDPDGAPCRDYFTRSGSDELLERIAQTQKRLRGVVRGIRQRAPRADVLLVGYLRIAPRSTTCPDVLPFADGDYAYLDSIERALNEAMATAARQTGVTYVDTYGPSRGHDACGTGGRPWVQGQDLDLLGAAPYHPNIFGMEGVADVLYEQVSGQQLTGEAAARVDRVVREAAAAAEAARAQARQPGPERDGAADRSDAARRLTERLEQGQGGLARHLW